MHELTPRASTSPRLNIPRWLATISVPKPSSVPPLWLQPRRLRQRVPLLLRPRSPPARQATMSIGWRLPPSPLPLRRNSPRPRRFSRRPMVTSRCAPLLRSHRCSRSRSRFTGRCTNRPRRKTSFLRPPNGRRRVAGRRRSTPRSVPPQAVPARRAHRRSLPAATSAPRARRHAHPAQQLRPAYRHQRCRNDRARARSACRARRRPSPISPAPSEPEPRRHRSAS